MSAASAFFDVDPALPFKYVGGDPALDFVNTVDWTDAGLIDERLATYDGLTRWAEGAALLTSAEASALRRLARCDEEAARGVVAEALALRELLHDLFTEVAAGHVSDAVLAAFNASLAAVVARRRVVAGSGGLAMGWAGWPDSLDAPLWPIVWSAAQLVASNEGQRVRVCGGPRCGWMFVDRSRNGLRHWCQTDVCGAREKARRHYARKKDKRAT